MSLKIIIFITKWIFSPKTHIFCYISAIWNHSVLLMLMDQRFHPAKNKSSVITAVLHSVGMKHRSLASASENACTWSGERFLFERAVVQGRLNYRLENVVFSFVIYVLLCVIMWTSLNLSRIASFKRSWELLLEVSTWLYVLSITLEL